jgi:hypothetical protein
MNCALLTTPVSVPTLMAACLMTDGGRLSVVKEAKEQRQAARRR